MKVKFKYTDLDIIFFCVFNEEPVGEDAEKWEDLVSKTHLVTDIIREKENGLKWVMIEGSDYWFPMVLLEVVDSNADII